jgi:hypothetical protein
VLKRGYCYKLNINSRQAMIKEYNRAAQKKGLPPASMCDIFAIFEERNGRARCMLDLGPYAHTCASVCIDQLEQHKAGRQSEGSWNYPTLFDLTEREAIKEYNKMWNRVANWP